MDSLLELLARGDKASGADGYVGPVRGNHLFAVTAVAEDKDAPATIWLPPHLQQLEPLGF